MHISNIFQYHLKFRFLHVVQQCSTNYYDNCLSLWGKVGSSAILKLDKKPDIYCRAALAFHIQDLNMSCLIWDHTSQTYHTSFSIVCLYQKYILVAEHRLMRTFDILFNMIIEGIYEIKSLRGFDPFPRLFNRAMTLIK